jgi:hypothetical protein
MSNFVSESAIRLRTAKHESFCGSTLFMSRFRCCVRTESGQEGGVQVRCFGETMAVHLVSPD